MIKGKDAYTFSANLVPNLRAASHPPFPIVSECESKALPLEQQGIDKDLVDLIGMLDLARKREFHVDL